MDAAVLAAIKSLLDGQRVLTAAVLVDGVPAAALLPFVASDDYTAVFIQASGLARHAQGLRPGATIGLVVHEPATPDRDAMQLPRLTVQATVEVVPRDSDAFDAAATRLIERFPAAATTLGLPDFNLYALTLGRGRYVEGFARAFNVGPDTFHALTPGPATTRPATAP